MSQIEANYKNAVKRITEQIKKEKQDGKIDLPFESSLPLELSSRLQKENIPHPSNLQQIGKTLHSLVKKNEEQKLNAIKQYLDMVKSYSTLEL